MARRNVGVKGAFLTQYSANLPAKYHYNLGYHAMTRRYVGVKGAFLTQYSANLPAIYHYNLSPPRLQLDVLSQLRTLEATRKGKMRCSGTCVEGCEQVITRQTGEILN